MSSVGLWMLLALAVATVTTRLPIWALLLATSTVFAAAGVALGLVDLNLLSAVPNRIVGILEHDLLQALPLYVFLGLLLQRLTLADAIFNSLLRLGRQRASARPLAAFGLSALLAPMNGSVAASAGLLSRLVAPHLRDMPPERAVATLSAASTIGVVVPPSLVLLLLGDAMMRAHTEASNMPGFVRVGRIINTHDVLNAALLPALVLLLAWMVVAAWPHKAQPADAGKSHTSHPVRHAHWRREAGLAALATGVILGLLAGVFSGALLAVEAAATAALLLALAAWGSRSLSLAQWQSLLDETLQVTGALLALLVGATTFSLVFRALGTDVWLSSMLLGSPLSAVATALLVLVFVAGCAVVLDAFEMIFVMIPIVAPPLVVLLGDAQQAAVLLLMVLQLSFMLPPLGYALMIVQSRAGLGHTQPHRLFAALLPYALAQGLVLAAVFMWPQTVHLLDAPLPPATQQDTTDPALDGTDALESMSPQTDDSAADNATETPAESPTSPASPVDAQAQKVPDSPKP